MFAIFLIALKIRSVMMEEINLVWTYIEANIDLLIELLLERGFEEMGQYFHPTWGPGNKGKIFSKPSSPMFWISHHPNSYSTVIIWIADNKPPYGITTPNNCIIGHEAVAIPKKSAEGAVNCLEKLFGEEHINVSFKADPHKSKEGWAISGEMQISFI